MIQFVQVEDKIEHIMEFIYIIQYLNNINIFPIQFMEEDLLLIIALFHKIIIMKQIISIILDIVQ